VEAFVTARLFAVVPIVIAVAFSACQPPLIPRGPVAVAGDTGTVDRFGRRVAIECPNVSSVGGSGSHAEHDPTVTVGLAGVNALIPEYHDCQRLVVGSAGSVNRYGALVGIFAAEALSRITPADFRRPGGAPVAQMYNFSSLNYAVLGIRPRYNCLYLRLNQDTTWSAHLLPTDTAEACPTLTSWPNSGQQLQVRRTTPVAGEQAYPAVARWDWDQQHRRNYIGVKCLDGWCEISAGPLQPSPVYEGQHYTEVVKGWYDEQLLAVPDAAGRLQPLVPARIVPAPRLDTLTERHYTCREPCAERDGWVRVATVHLGPSPSDHYRTKLNFTPGANQMFLRRRARDGREVWQTRIISAAGDTAYRRTLRVAHPNHPMPATARWHWREDDELSWVRCALGCCESSSDPLSINEL
jgi:hypothetical protein